jgi:hypothetical protein
MTMSADYLANEGEIGTGDLGVPADTLPPDMAGLDTSVYPKYGPVNTDPTMSVTGGNPLAAIPSVGSAYGQSGQATGTLYDPATGKIVPASSVNAGQPAQSTWASVLGLFGLAAQTTTAIVNSQKQAKAGSQRTLATTAKAPMSSTTILLLGVGVLAVIILFGRKRG